MGPRSRYLRSLQYKWGTGMCLRKKCLDINQRLIITLNAMSSKRHLKRFISRYLAGEEGCAAERSRSETNGIREGLVQCSVNVSDFWTGSSAAQ